MSHVFEGNDISLIFTDTLNNLGIVYRDIFGKRSLIMSYSETEILISSVSFTKGMGTFELPPSSILAFNLAS